MVALVHGPDGLRLIGPHTLNHAEETTLLKRLEPHVQALPVPENEGIYTYPAGRPHQGSITPEWEATLENNDEDDEAEDEQTSLDQYNETNIKDFIHDEIEKALPEATSPPLRFPTVF